MTSFTNRIKPDSTELERYFLSVYTGNLWDALEKIKDWHSPEHIEKEIKRLRKINHLYKKAKGNAERLAVDRGERLNQAQDELAFLESQLQQQALPVVPKLTQKQADILNDYKNGSGSLAKYLSVEIKKRDYDYFARAWLDGYTVEKPHQKFYEVKLLSGESMHFNPIGNPKNIKDYRFSFGNYAGWKTKFTKSELIEIKDGTFLKRIPGGTPLNDLSKDKSCYVWLEDCNYWINPLIELVPVEDGE